MDTAFRPLLNTTVTVTTSVSLDRYGVATYTGTASTYRARVVQKAEKILDIKGNEATSSHIAWIDSTGTIAHTDRIVFNDGTSPPIQRVERYPDENGYHHLKVFLGSI